MTRIKFIILPAVLFVVTSIYWFYGAYAFISTPFFLLAFVSTFGLTAYLDARQARSIHGIEKLAEPEFFFSRIFMAWLYVNDRQRWARYAASYSYLLGILWGTLIAIFFALPLDLEFSVLLVAWVFGMFVTLLLAITIATSRRWTVKTG